MAAEKPKLPAGPTQPLAAAKMEEILNKTVFDALMQATPEQVIRASPDAEIIKGTARGSIAWRHAPAMIELLAVADKRLTRTANEAGQNVTKVEKVHAFLLKGTKILVLQAAPSNDMTAYPVSRYRSSGAWINLMSLLGEVGFTGETGWKDRFEVAYVPKGSPFWPGLVIDLSNAKERRRESKKRNVEATTQP